MFNSESDKKPSSTSSKIRPASDRQPAIGDQGIAPREVRPNSVDEDEHHTRLGEHSKVLWRFNKFTDVTVKLNDEKYLAHKTVLSCYSRYLKNMLLESQGKVDLITLKLKHVTNEAFSTLLRYMYTSDLELTCQNIGEVYTAARKLGMDTAVDICSKILKGEDRREVHSVYVFVTSWKLGLDDDASRALSSMCRRFEHIVGTQEFLDLDYEQVVEYLKADVLATRSEVIVYLAALKWLSVRYLEREEHAVAVLSCVRFPKMTLGEVLACHSPPLLPGLVEMPELKEMLLRATCFVAAKTTNEEKRFQRYDCPERTYLLEKETIILWDPSIFDPLRYALYTEETAASTIQAVFRNYQTKKAQRKKDGAAETIQKAFRRHSRQRRQDREDEEESSTDEEYEREWSQKTAEDSSGGGVIKPFAERMRQSITSLFGRSSPEMDERDSSDEEDTYSVHKNRRRAKKDVKQVEKSVANLAKTVNDTEEDTYGAIVISGGYNGDNEDHLDSGKLLLIYEPAIGEWSTLGEMYKPRHHHHIVYLKGFIYCIGGCNPERTKKKEKMVPVKSCHAFDMNSGTWKKIAKMRHCRVYHATTVLNGKIYVAGGKDERDRMLDSVEVYDPDSDSWEPLYDALETPTIGAGMCSKDGKLFLVGGMSQDSTGKIAVSKKVSTFDPNTEQWTTDIPSLPYPRAFASAVVCGSRVFVIGGSSHAGPSFPTHEMSSFDDVYFYEEATKEWKRAPRLPTPRHFVGAVAVYKSLFVLGGLTSFKKQALDEILLLNEESGTWVLSARIPGPLCGIGAASVPKLMLNKM